MSNGAASAIWSKQKRWSAAADRLKSQLNTWRTAAFALGIAGAFLETLSTQVPSGRAQQICALAGALCLGIIPVLTLRKLGPERGRAWVRTRSASEGLKSEVYAFLARAAPYDETAGAGQILLDKASGIEESVEDLLRYQAGEESDESGKPEQLTPEEYLAKRVHDQIDWYRPKAAGFERKARRLRSIELVLAITAAALAAAAGVYGDSLSVLGWSFVFAAWVAVLTTIGGAITAHVGASRYDFLITSYLGTARRLEDLASRWQAAPGGAAPSPEWSEFVKDCENAISTDNQGWMAKWTKA